MRTRTLLGLAAAVLLSLALAGCGGDDGDDTDTTTTEAADDTTTTTEATTGTTPSNAGEAFHDFLDTENPELADMIEGFGSVDIGQGEAQLSLTIGDEPADADTGVAICDAALTFADGAGYSAFEVEVQNDENGDDALLATGDLDDGCEAA